MDVKILSNRYFEAVFGKHKFSTLPTKSLDYSIQYPDNEIIWILNLVGLVLNCFVVHLMGL